MKIDISKITDNTAVHCSKIEYIELLFEAMGKSDISTAKGAWRFYGGEVYFTTGNTMSDRKWFEEQGYTIIEFEDLIIHESNLIKVLHAVGVGDWLQEGVEFRFEELTFRIFDDVLEVNEFGDWRIVCDDEY